MESLESEDSLIEGTVSIYADYDDEIDCNDDDWNCDLKSVLIDDGYCHNDDDGDEKTMRMNSDDFGPLVVDCVHDAHDFYCHY